MRIGISLTDKIKLFLRRSRVGRVGWESGLLPFVAVLSQAVRRPRKVLRNEWVLRKAYRSFARNYKWLRTDPGAAQRGSTLLIVYSGDWALQAKLVGMLIKGLQSTGSRPVVLLSRNQYWATRFFKLFGIRKFVYWEDYTADNFDAIATELRQSFQHVRDAADLIQISHEGIEVGRWALSTLLRQFKSSRVDLQDPEARRSSFEALLESARTARIAKQILAETRPQQVLFYEKGYTPFGEIFNVSVRQSIDVLQWLHSQRTDALLLKRYTADTWSIHPSSLSPESWSQLLRMPWSDAQGKLIQDELRSSYESGTWFNRKFLLHDKRIRTKADVQQELGLDTNRKTAVIFSHVLWDATFFYGRNLFRDYEEWLTETVKAACRNDALNWVVKIHPDYVWKLKREHGTYHRGMLTEYLALASEVGELPGHVKVMHPESDISTFSLFSVTDYCLTVRGTIGMEMACFGIPVFTAGTGRYSNLGFTRDSESREEYLAKLARLHEVSPMSEEQTSLAQRYAHGVFVLRPLPFESFTMVRGQWSDPAHPLSHDIEINVHSLKEYLMAPDIHQFVGWAADRGKLDYLTLPSAEQSKADRLPRVAV